jgi:hypothetical protein
MLPKIEPTYIDLVVHGHSVSVRALRLREMLEFQKIKDGNELARQWVASAVKCDSIEDAFLWVDSLPVPVLLDLFRQICETPELSGTTGN